MFGTLAEIDCRNTQYSVKYKIMLAQNHHPNNLNLSKESYLNDNTMYVNLFSP